MRRDRGKLRQLAERMAAIVEGGEAQPKVSVVLAPSRRADPTEPMDWVEREGRIRMIRHLARRYQAQILVDQALVGYVGLEGLPDDELRVLHSSLHDAYECMVDGMSFEDAGLLRRSKG